jgi:Ca-activated chloride channel family protein
VDRQLSCQSVKTIKSLTEASANNQQLIDSLTNIQATGWTPIDRALQKAENLLSSHPDDLNYIIVLSDGMETCDGQPAQTAERLRDSGIQVTTSVVGLAVTSEQRSQLESIATSGGGEYYDVESEIELTQALRQWSDIAKQWEQIRACLFTNFTRYSGCINLQYLQSIEYLTQTRSEYESTHHLLLPHQYPDLEAALWSQLNKLRDENRQWYTQESLSTHLNL